MKNRLCHLIHPNSSYLDVWSRVLTSEEFRKECANVLHIIELLLITPFSNATADWRIIDLAEIDWKRTSESARNVLVTRSMISAQTRSNHGSMPKLNLNCSTILLTILLKIEKIQK
jgi:hypothetical protein